MSFTSGNGLPEQPLPWVLALHGLGDRPDNFLQLFAGLSCPLHVYALQAPRDYVQGFDWFGARLLGEPDKLAAGIADATSRVVNTARALSERQENIGKAIVTGFSQGGALSYAVAVGHPELFSLSAPISGWLPESFVPHGPSGARVPIRAFHGELDPLVPVGPTRELVSRLSALGLDANLRVYADVPHRISPAMHENWTEILLDQCQKSQP